MLELLPRNARSMKAGVAIAGALWWDQTEPLPEWRGGLDVDRNVLAYLPIRYGRRWGTRASVYTCVYSGSCVDERGIATGFGRIVPFARREMSPTELIDEAEALAEAEGLIGSPWPEWGAPALWLRPDWQSPERDELCNVWPRFLSDRLPAGSWLMRDGEDAPEPQLLAAPFFELALPWPLSADAEEPVDFDALLVAVNRPTYVEGRFASPGDVARSFIEAGDPSYFIHNIEAGIRTAFDNAIWLRVLEMRPDWSRRYPNVVDRLQRAS